MKTRIFSAFVNNNSGVLTRISGLFARRGYNIKSLTVGETTDPRVSRMTIECLGDDRTFEQIESQLGKVEDVISVAMLDPERTVCRELFLISVRSGALPQREENDLDYRVVSQSASGAVYELCGTGEDLGRFCALFDGVEFDIARTGITAVEK
ncbi:MAG: acetolactate synthase small subunit [Clostridia bacterium]|nr:acetolactate synthase small subunit [Clostridia bacterium]